VVFDRRYLRRGWLLTSILALMILVLPAVARAQGTLAVSNVQCNTLAGFGYTFTVSGSGFAPNAEIVVWVSDSNVFPGPPPFSQPNSVLTDAGGGFRFDFSGGPAQQLPGTVQVTDALLNTLAGPVPVACPSGPPPGGCDDDDESEHSGKHHDSHVKKPDCESDDEH
jgi:hypothetical protein